MDIQQDPAIHTGLQLCGTDPTRALPIVLRTALREDAIRIGEIEMLRLRLSVFRIPRENDISLRRRIRLHQTKTG